MELLSTTRGQKGSAENVESNTESWHKKEIATRGTSKCGEEAKNDNEQLGH